MSMSYGGLRIEEVRLTSWEELRERARILVVGDDLLEMDRVGEIFSNAGYRRVEVERSPAAIRQQILSFDPDLIVIDVEATGPGPIPILEEIREIVLPESYLPVIALTDGKDAVTLRSLVAGAKDFQTKPVDFVELLLRARSRLETRFRVRQLEDEVRDLRRQLAVRDGFRGDSRS